VVGVALCANISLKLRSHAENCSKVGKGIAVFSDLNQMNWTKDAISFNKRQKAIWTLGTWFIQEVCTLHGASSKR